VRLALKVVMKNYRDFVDVIMLYVTNRYSVNLRLPRFPKIPGTNCFADMLGFIRFCRRYSN
jgi:hypothetical protein